MEVQDKLDKLDPLIKQFRLEGECRFCANWGKGGEVSVCYLSRPATERGRYVLNVLTEKED